MHNLLNQQTDRKYPIPENEKERQAKLESYDILDTLPENEFDSLVELAAIITDSPISLMNLLDHDRQWTKASFGNVEVKSAHRSESVCQYTILQDSSFEVEDLRLDERFKDKSFVTNDPQYRSYSGYPLITPGGLKIGALCVLDFTPKKLNERQKKALKTISGEIVSRLELRKKQKELEQLNKEKDQFLRIVNHDIKSPINGIISAVHYLENMWEGDRKELEQFLSMIRLSGQKLIHYTRELMENSMSFQQAKIRPQDVMVCESISDLIDIYKPLASAKEVTLEFNCLAKNSFFIDEEKFKLILSNLISNALKFTDKNDTISIDAEIIEGSPRLLHVSVTDSGIGIPEHFQTELFTKNKKLQRQGTRGEISTGMGLPLVKEFVDLHNGIIKVNSREGEGSTFHIVLTEQEDN